MCKLPFILSSESSNTHTVHFYREGVLYKRYGVNPRNYLHPFSRIVAICLVGAMSLFASCDKSENTPGGIDHSDSNSQYVLQPGTIRIEPFGGSTPATRAAVAIKEESHSFNTGVEQGNVITLGNSEVEDTPATRTLADGIYYRIVVYKLSEFNATAPKIFAQRLCKTGQTGYSDDAGDTTDPILCDVGDYRIFCYSFNKTSTAKMEPLADGVVTIPLTEGDDFLSADIIERNITSDQLSTDVSLGSITLQHRCCRLTGILATKRCTPPGIESDPVPRLSVSSTFTTAGTWSIKSPGFTASATNSATKEIPLKENADTHSGTLMLLPRSGKSLTTSYTFKPKGAERNYIAYDTSVSSSATFSSGGSYAFTVTAIGAYVLTDPTPEGYVEIGEYKWAYANLKSGSSYTMEDNPWESGQQKSDDNLTNDYWRWNMADVDTSSEYPADPPVTWVSSIDPCGKKMGSSWKVPLDTEFNNLKRYCLVEKEVNINGVTTETNAYGFVTTETVAGCVFADNTKGTCIFLPAAGYRYGSDYVSVGEGGSYWSATGYPSNTNNAYGLNINTHDCNVYGSPRNYGYSLRCVHK